MNNITKGFYKHYKGKIYQVLHTGKHTETLQELVVYRSANDEDDQIWVRPADMFNEHVKKIRRFTRIKDYSNY